MDWGGYIIIATLMWPDGHTDRYTPTTLFDEQACLREALQINAEWRKFGVEGVALCIKAEEE